MDYTALKKSFMGGYNKKSVHELLSFMEDKHTEQLAALAEEKGALCDKVTELEDEIKSLTEKAQQLETDSAKAEREKEYIAAAIVSAEKEAAKILSEAAIEAEKIKADTLSSLKAEKDKITDLRMSLYQAMQTYKDKLDTIASRTDCEE